MQLRISVCLFFLCLGFSSHLRFFLLMFRSHHYRWKAANFDICSVPNAIAQWGFLSVPQLLWHETSVYYGQLQGTVTHTFRRVFGWRVIATCFPDWSVVAGIRTPNIPLAGRPLWPTGHNIMKPLMAFWNKKIVSCLRDYVTGYALKWT